KRRYEEMDEVIELLLESEDPKMNKATQDHFKELHLELGKLSERPGSYAEIFEQIMRKRNQK
ncbi:MAG: hypothetical protein ACXVH2_08880, partial [Methanobacterium sp.]